ncbi:hypothetical protein C1H46_034209 [Malus baccata]|uniref:Uncharacterized protein n=1 Tax=Malus baccata TaxID=106549 RepID=A0A540L198_MALBA|nr:hypothetical protein C1H46_034209 [Malus baccata]
MDHPTRGLISFNPSSTTFSSSGQAFKVRQSSIPTFSTLPHPMVVTLTSQFNLRTGEMLHYVEDDSAPSSPLHEATRQPPTTFVELIVPEIPMVSEATGSRVPLAFSRASSAASSKATTTMKALPKISGFSQVSGKRSDNSHPHSASKDDLSQPSKAITPHLPLPEALSSTQASGNGSGKPP